jgi:hypothetical protein
MSQAQTPTAERVMTAKMAEIPVWAVVPEAVFYNITSQLTRALGKIICQL